MEEMHIYLDWNDGIEECHGERRKTFLYEANKLSRSIDILFVPML
jgi:hypothetical protein